MLLVDIRLTEIGGRRAVRNLTRLETVVVEIAPSEARPGMQEAFLEVQRGQDFTVRTGERYISNPEGREFVYVFSITLSTPSVSEISYVTGNRSSVHQSW